VSPKEAIALRNRLVSLWGADYWVDWWRESADKSVIEWSMSKDHIPSLQSLALPQSPVYYVDDDALDVLAEAAKTFQPEPLLASDLMTPSGFMVLERPLYAYGPLHEEPVAHTVAPRNWENISTRSPLLWHWWPVVKVGPGMEDDALQQWAVAPTGDAPADGVVISGYLYTDAHEWLLAQNHVIPFGHDFWVKNTSNVTVAMTAFQALLRLMQQQVLSTTREATGSKKSKRKSKTEPVLVVRLPRRRSHSTGEATVAWSKQWWVSGHWRNQWYPSLQAHRQKWISGYVKGPDDKPFVGHEERAFVAHMEAKDA
jgi:hypothetical protein